MTTNDLARRLRERIAADGPLAFSDYVEAALYDPTDGFYSVRGGAGRRRDFLTNPHVGPLFGILIGRYLDRWWTALGEPHPFWVFDAGAGDGTLARTVIAGAPRCLGSLRYVSVEISEAQRQLHRHGHFNSPDLPERLDHPAVVIANELLDNLPFDVMVRGEDGWSELRIGLRSGRLAEVRVPVPWEGPDVPVGTKVPIMDRARAWVEGRLRMLPDGGVMVIDYTDLTLDPWAWVRTFRRHQRGRTVTAYPGYQDITAAVIVEQLPTPHRRRRQWEFLTELGIADLVAEGRRIWRERDAVTLAAVTASSRVYESEALLDPEGLGGFEVLEWAIRPESLDSV